jgi:hypothetical protein
MNRRELIAGYPLLVGFCSYFEDATWAVQDLPGLSEQLEAFIVRAKLDKNLTGKLWAIHVLVDEAIARDRPLVAVAD